MLNKLSWILLLFSLSLGLQAGVREASGGSGKMVAKLQAMMRQVSKERDNLKVENAKLKTELDGLNKQHKALVADEKKVSRKLLSQQGSNRKLEARQTQTYDKLLEVVEKYKTLKQQKNQLSSEYTQLQQVQHNTDEQLSICGQHNVKLISSAEELLQRYQDKGTFSGLLQSEGVLQFQSVEMESIVQDYEDKIRTEQYQKTLSLNQSE